MGMHLNTLLSFDIWTFALWESEESFQDNKNESKILVMSISIVHSSNSLELQSVPREIFFVGGALAGIILFRYT
jgi:hypothetical protein